MPKRKRHFKNSGNGMGRKTSATERKQPLKSEVQLATQIKLKVRSQMEVPNGADAVNVQLHTALKAAVADITSMPPGEQRTWALCGIATMLMGKPENIKAASIQQCPELASAGPIPDTHLSKEEQEIALSLTVTDMLALDSALVAGSLTTWRNVARVVGGAMAALDSQLSLVPIGIFIRRVEALVQEGRLEAKGNTQFMRFSEVRLPASDKSAD